MNGVSDLKLALACARAGILPSLIPYSYPSFVDFFKDLEILKKTTDNVLVAFRLHDVVDSRLTNKLIKSNISHIELLEYEGSLLSVENIKKMQLLMSAGIDVSLKITNITDIETYKDIISSITIKSPESAGRSEQIDIIETISKIKNLYPTLRIVASGGISNKEDIQRLVAAGADAVSIGTLFALSEESSIPHNVKVSLLNKTSSDITRLQNGAQQRAIVFNKENEHDFNNTRGLLNGISSGSAGHIFVGNAIDSITKIITVREIVDYLTV